MMEKIFLLPLFLFLFVIPGLSQVQLTQYFLDETLYNPAFAGANDAICAGSYLRNQWMGLTDANGNKVAPLSGVFNFHAPVYSLNGGRGMNVVYDKAGFEQNLGVKFNYAYHVPFKDDNNLLSIGIGVSVLSKTIDFSRLTPEQPNDPLFKSAKKESGIIPDLDFGIQYQLYKKVYAGISAVNLMESSANIGSVRYAQKRNFYLMGGFYAKLIDERNSLLYLIPSFLVKSNLINVQADINTRVDYNNRYWGGVSWRYQDALAVMAGVNLNGFRIGASYDLTTSYLSRSSNGSVEFFVGYCHPIGPKMKKRCNFNTRYL